MKKITIDIGKEFSMLPAGRFHSDGESSAEAFFIRTLDGLLYDGYYVELEFHNVLQAGSTFLYHLTGLLVSYGWNKKVSIVKDDKWEYTKWRWDKYMDEHQGRVV